MQMHRFSTFFKSVCVILLTHAMASSVHAETITTVIQRYNADWVSLFNTESKHLICFGPRTDNQGIINNIIGSTFLDVSQEFRNVPTDRFQILFGIAENLLYLLNSDTGKLVGYQIKRTDFGIPQITKNFVHESSIGKNVLMKIYPLRDDDTTGGVFLYSRETGKLTILYVNPNNEDSVSVMLTHDVKADDKQGLLNVTELKMDLSNAREVRIGGFVRSSARINIVSSKVIIRYVLQHNRISLTQQLPVEGTLLVEGYYPLGQ